MRATATLSLLGACLLTSGCQSAYLYNKKSDAIAKAAAEDYEASKFSEHLKAQRKVLVTLEDREVSAFSKLTLAERDQALLALVSSQEKGLPVTTKDGFANRLLEKIDGRLIALDGNPDARHGARASEVKARALLKVSREGQVRARQNLALPNDGFDSIEACSDKVAKLEKATTSDAIKALVEPNFESMAVVLWPSIIGSANELGKQCRIEQEQLAILKELKPERSYFLDRAVTAYEVQESAIKSADDKAKALKSAMTTAAKDLAAATKSKAEREALTDFSCPAASDAAVAPADPTATSAAAAGALAATAKLTTEAPTTPDTEPKKTVITSASNLCKALTKLKDLGFRGRKVVAEEKIARIRDVLQAMSGITPETQSADTDSSLALIAATTRLSGALRMYQQAGKWPLLEPLIIEKQLADAQLASANAQVALEKRRLTYHAEIVTSIRSEIELLDEARYSLVNGFGELVDIRQEAPCSNKNLKRCSSYEALLSSNTRVNGVPEERAAYRAMALFAESYSVGRDRQMAAGVRLALSNYQRSYILSEEAVASWTALLNTPVDLLRQYHAGGITTDDVAPVISILQTIGIFGIADRVK